MVSSKTLPSLAALLPSILALQIVDDSQCDCYLTDGSSPTYFRNHGFWDFRSLSQYARVPATINSVQGNADADFSSAYFNYESRFGEFWGPQNWSNEDPDFPMINSFNNLYIENNDGGQSDTFMTMRTTRFPGFQTAAEFESINVHDHASMRMLARTTGSTGACTAIFTYLGAEHLRDVQEADIEILTRDPHNAIHYTNQPSYLEDGTTIPEASRNVTLPNGKSWDEWVTHRLDWTPGMSTFSVDGTETHAQAFQAPKDPSRIILNAWSSGGSWTQKMPQGGEARQQIQWIEILYDVVDGNSCQSVCSIDKTPQVGKPVRL